MTCHSAHAHQLECCKWSTQLHTMCSLPATYTGNAGTLHWQVLRKVLHVSAKFELLSSSPKPRRAGWEAQQLLPYMRPAGWCHRPWRCSPRQ